MSYYKIAVLGSVLEPLTYHSQNDLPLLSNVFVMLQGKEKVGVVISKTKKPDFETLEVVAQTQEFFFVKQYELAKFIASYYVCSLGEAFALMHPQQRDVTCNDDVTCNATSIQLSQRQQKALAFLQQHPVSLLFGDTGSGKTEIYMKYFEQIIKEGKRVIFLMPEISLTPQMSKRLQKHFGKSFVMWHSKLTPKQKKEALQKIRCGDAKIIAGARSALFLPIDDLGLIVVDEEHDDSYKSSSRPRYHARDLAIFMGKLYGAPVVLGSATPSLNTYVKFPHIRLKGGHVQAKKEYIFEAAHESMSPLVYHHLKNNLTAKKQAIIFLPTRANFKYLSCKSCGENFECPYCSVAMSIHNKYNALKCHYCNFTQAIPQSCPTCNATTLSSDRMGTAEVVKELLENIPEIKVQQFDRDTITTANKLKRALQSFNDKKSDVLVGTQMLSKGHDYHGVELAVIFGMDNMLNIADYRAREKALSTLIQVAGRSGRASEAKVLIQTFNESFFKEYIENYELFLEEEKLFREGLYPPYKKLCRIMFAHKNGQKAQNEMEMMREALQRFNNVEIVGAKKCAIEKVANKYRFEILLRADKATDILKALKSSQTPLAQIDMDPIDFS